MLLKEARAERKKDLPLAHALVASMLGEGKENCLTSKEIIRRLGWRSQRNLLQIMHELVTEYGYPIGASRVGVNKGYYMLASYEELVETTRSYNAQIQKMMKRHRKLQENWAKRNQESLDI